jgi:hypothetical protein
MVRGTIHTPDSSSNGGNNAAGKYLVLLYLSIEQAVSFQVGQMLAIDKNFNGLYSSRSFRFYASAEVVKLVDTPASGAGGGNPVKVQVLSSAPILPHSTKPPSIKPL